MTGETSANRMVSFDIFRLFLVLGVVVQHAGNGYNNLIWWPVSDGQTSLTAEWITMVLDTFTMPLLYFLAGYFAVPTVQKKGPASFIKGKLKRLGIPWLVCILTICPILPLIYHYTRNNFTLTESYFETWKAVFGSALEFNFRIIGSMNELMQNNQFYQRYMWFMSLLILFFLIFAAVYALKKSWFERLDDSWPVQKPTAWSTLKFLGAVGITTVILSFTTVMIMFVTVPGLTNPEPLLTLGNVIQFRPSRFFLYSLYFVLGIVMYRNRWIERGKFPGHGPTWAVSFTIVLVLLLGAWQMMVHGPEELEKPFGAAYFFLNNFMAVCSLGLFSWIFIKFVHRPTALKENLAANSYNIYLAHYIFVIALQLVLLSMPEVPGLVKFIAVTVLSMGLAYGASQFLIRPYPKITVAVCFSMLLLMLFLCRPGLNQELVYLLLRVSPQIN